MDGKVFIQTDVAPIISRILTWCSNTLHFPFTTKANPMTRIAQPTDLYAKMKEVLKSNDGWKASGALEE